MTQDNSHESISSRTARAAEKYISKGYCVVPVPAGEKNPNRGGWEKLRISHEKIPQYFNNGQNIGIHTGEASGGLVDVDLDVKEARAIAGRFLPATLTSGRPSSPDSHWWYYADGAKYRMFSSLPPEPETLLEIRAENHHTLVAPSVHPSGERLEWSRSGLERCQIDADELTAACQRLATSVLIARNLPEVRDPVSGAGGGRHNLALALAGFLIRRELSEEDVLSILLAAWDARGFAGDSNAEEEAHRDLEGLVGNTARRIADGEEATGGQTLEDLVPGLVKKICGYWSWSSRIESATAGKKGKKGKNYTLTDYGNAERLVARHGQDLHYLYAWGKWLVWDGRRWAMDDTGEVERRAKETARSIYAEAAAEPDDSTRKAIAAHAKSSEARSRIDAMLAQTRSEPGIPIRHTELDADPWLFTIQNGTINLRTGELRDHDPANLITKLAPVEYDPDAEAPVWDEFLEEILPSPEVRQYMQKLIGYSLTGKIAEHILPICYGVGANGKSTLLNTVLELVGDYGLQAANDMLVVKRDSHPTDQADLFGRRFVTNMETEDGKRFAESRVKQLTGGDKVRARRMREDFWEFPPTHTLWLATNHKPEVRGTDNAIWRRLRLIPFEVAIPPEDQDKHLDDKLRAELPGILRWAVEGCLAWQREGLGEPDEVMAATKTYREEMDSLSGWLDECCVETPGAWAELSDLYQSYDDYCDAAHERAVTKRTFGGRLSERGFEPDKGTGNVAIRRGIGLLSNTEHTSEASKGDSRVTGVIQGVTQSNSQNTCKSQENEQGVTQSYSKSGLTSQYKPRVDTKRNRDNSDNSDNSEGNSEAYEGGYVEGEINPNQEPPDEEPDPPQETREAEIEEALGDLNAPSETNAENAGGDSVDASGGSGNAGEIYSEEWVRSELERLAKEEGVEPYEGSDPGEES